MSLLKVLVAVFFVLGSSVLFVSIGRYSQSGQVLSHPVDEIDTTGKIIFHLLEGEYSPVSSAEVSLFLITKNGIKPLIKYTDDLGYAEFDRLHNGDYNWKVRTRDSLHYIGQGSIKLDRFGEETKTIRVKR